MLTFNDAQQTYLLRSDDEERAKACGLTLSTTTRGANGEKIWYTSAGIDRQPMNNPYAALPFYDEADKATQARLSPLKAQYRASWALDSAYEPPAPPGLEYMPFQKAGIKYALDRQHTLLGDMPGLGKTIQAIGFANAIEARHVLVVVPGSIRLQWQRKIKEWSTLPRVSTYPILKSKDGANLFCNYNIVSYDLTRNVDLHAALCSRPWDLIIWDEGHFLKTYDALRTRAAFGGGEGDFRYNWLAKHAERLMILTGTPLPNRPRECLGADTQVLTPRGWVRIVDVCDDDLLWDGVEWVKHDGVLSQGCAKTVSVAGISATKDHLFLAKSSWVSAEEAVQNTDTLNQVLERGSASSPSQVVCAALQAAFRRWSAPATVGGQHRRPSNDFGLGAPPNAALVGLDRVVQAAKLRLAPTIMCAQIAKSETNSGLLSPARTRGAATLGTKTTAITVGGASSSTSLGSKTGSQPWSTSSPSKGTMTCLRNWIESTTTRGTRRGTYSGLVAGKTHRTAAPSENLKAKSPILKPVYDIANAGPRRRFMVLSDRGPVLSHNCYTLARALDWESIDWMAEEPFQERFNLSGQMPWGERVEVRGRLPELQARLRCNFMVRRRKKDVLKDLPDAQVDVTYIEHNGAIKDVLRREKLLDFDPAELFRGDFDMDGPISTVRREMGEAMVPRIAEYMRYLLDVVEVPKVCLFCHHRSVMDELIERLGKYGVAVIRGGMSVVQKDAQKMAFIKGTPRVFLGQNEAAGLGTDGLQEIATHVVIAEPAWRPGDNEQIVDRLHRMGQHGNVIASFLMVEGSFNELVFRTVIDKAGPIYEALDRSF